MTKETKKELQKTLLLTLGAGVIIPAIVIAPGATLFLKFFKEKRYEKYNAKEIRSVLRQMRREKLVSYAEIDNKLILSLTKSGAKRSLSYTVEKISLDTTRRWDRIWRIVTFDIPETEKTNRELFRERLKLLGLQQLQKSIWITPYPCYNEIMFLASSLEVDPYVILFETKNIYSSKLIYHQFT